MIMDYKSIVRKGKLAVFESSGISETGEAMPTKIDVHAWTSIDVHACTCMYIKKFNLSESAQKIHASRYGCVMHVHQFWWV